jgi:hypothetical protein
MRRWSSWNCEEYRGDECQERRGDWREQGFALHSGMGRFAWIVAICMWAALPGCAAEPRASIDPSGAAPADFSLEVSILAPSSPGKRQAVDQTSSRYVLFPDGALHYAIDPVGSPGRMWLPPYVRCLSQAEVEQVWSISRHLGLTDPQRADNAINFRVSPPSNDEVVYQVRFSGFDRRWGFVRRAPISESPDRAISQLVKELARLAWADERLRPAEVPVPKRYDFGPDPYAPYRAGSAETGEGK